MIEEFYFFFVFLRNGEVKQSMLFDSLEEAINKRRIMISDVEDVANISPVMKGYL